MNEKELLSHAAKMIGGLEISLWCERQHSIIYGSQIKMLEKLDQTGGLDEIQMLAFFNDAKLLHLNFYENMDLDTYLAWPIQVGIITAEEGRYFLTKSGKTFLSWWQQSGHAEKTAI